MTTSLRVIATLAPTWLVLASGCATAGTVITATPVRLTVPRAVDQAILGDAIDAAFATLKTEDLQAGVRGAGAAVTALVDVEAPVGLPEAVVAYVRGKATTAVGLAGVAVLDLDRVVERPYPNSPTELAYWRRPDTVARVVVSVAYAGVDDDVKTGQQDAPGSPVPDRVLRGRFKATLAIVPRRGAFAGSAHTIEGSTTYDVINGKYLDYR